MNRDTRWYDYILININYLALTARCPVNHTGAGAAIFG